MPLIRPYVPPSNPDPATFNVQGSHLQFSEQRLQYEERKKTKIKLSRCYQEIQVKGTRFA